MRRIIGRAYLFNAVISSILTLFVASESFGAMVSYKHGKLKNGLELVFLEDHKVPLVTIVIAVKAGAMMETPANNGLTHLWEHMFFKGNQTLANQEAFSQRVRELGIIYNGDTAAEKVRYYFTLPSVFLEQGIEFMANAMMTPLLDTTEIEKERQVVLNEWDRNASQPAFDLYGIKRKILYGSKGYLRDPLGDRQVIEKATRQQLLDIKDQVFVPSNSCLFVAGDFDEATVNQFINKYFASWQDPKNWAPTVPPPFPPFPAPQELIKTHPDAKNVMISYSYDGPLARRQPMDSFAADMLINLLNLSNGKFHQQYVESNLSLAAGFGYSTQSQVGELVLYALTQPDKALKIKEMLTTEPAKWLAADYFTEEQLADVKRQLVVDYKLQLNKPSEYINTLAFWWAVTGLDYYESYLDNLKHVTLDDVRGFIRGYLVNKPSVTVVFLSPNDAKKIGISDNSASFKADLLNR